MQVNTSKNMTYDREKILNLILMIDKYRYIYTGCPSHLLDRADFIQLLSIHIGDEE